MPTRQERLAEYRWLIARRKSGPLYYREVIGIDHACGHHQAYAGYIASLEEMETFLACLEQAMSSPCSLCCSVQRRACL